jgi:hypothetical protein
MESNDFRAVPRQAHTPGPWSVEKSPPYVSHVYAGQFKVADVHQYGGGELDRARREADARLIAAGPALLGALRPLAAIPIGPEIEHDRDLILYRNAGRDITVGDVLDARAVIAKAEGRS